MGRKLLWFIGIWAVSVVVFGTVTLGLNWMVSP
jgi:hypothetical protein